MDRTSWFISNVVIRQRVTNREGRSSGMSGIVAAVISSAAVQSKEVAAEGRGRDGSGKSNVLVTGEWCTAGENMKPDNTFSLKQELIPRDTAMSVP